MRGLLLAGVIVVAAALAAAAQPQTIGQHFRAYNAALESGDLATAEREAAAALQLSERQDGDGGHTAVLALNLATTRLSAGHGADALAPAQEALRIARANSSSGVDAKLAAIVEGHAALLAQADGAAARLTLALDAISGRVYDADVYTAAADLGLWQFRQAHYVEARRAWQHAIDAAAGSAYGRDLGSAYANISLAGAIIMNGVDQHLSLQDVQTASEALYAADTVLWPRQTYVPLGMPLPASVKQYALSNAWHALLNVELAARNMPPAHPRQRIGTPQPDLSNNDPRPICKNQMMQNPPLQYPNAQEHARHIGAVAVFMQTDDSGAVVRHEVAAEVGAGFADSTAVMGQWRLVRARDAQPNCRLSTQAIVRITYAF